MSPDRPTSARADERKAVGSALEGALRDRVGRAAARAGATRGDIVFDARPAGVWTVRFRGGRATLRRGRRFLAASTLRADPETMLAVIEGRERGADAFLAGRLSVRGNLALPMELDDLLPPATRDERAIRVRRVFAAGLSTFCLEAGPMDAPVVVLLHGLGATSASFLPTLCDLSADHRVVAIDLAGFGESDKPLRPLHAAFFARHVVEVLDALGVPRAHLVGNSMGGRVALEVGLRSPERVGRLVLLCPSLAWRRFRFAAGLLKFVRHELAAVPLPAPHLGVTTALRFLFADARRVPRTGMLAGADEFRRVFATPRGRVALFNAMREIYLDEPHGERGFWERLPRLSPPALFVFGDKDILVPKSFARHVADALPAAKISILEDCGHVPQFEHPARTHALVRAFLRGDGDAA